MTNSSMESQTPPLKQISPLPDHVAVIPDGNGRWAHQKGLPRIKGHRAGIESTRIIVRRLSQYGIKYLTFYSFSTENWKRPKREIGGLLKLLEESLKKEVPELNENNVHLNHIGRLDRLPPGLRRIIKEAIELTSGNSGLVLSLAFDYGGRSEILNAVRNIIEEGIKPSKIDEKLLSKHLYTAGLPDVDLVIRTSGEYRISNFLLWQSAYSEYYFTDVLWPNFDSSEIDKSLTAYSQRKRRFGSL